jgi:uncharacterized protein (TIGR01777 family)
VRVLVSGASGLVGSALVPALQSDGDEVVRLVRLVRDRPAASPAEIAWDPAAGSFDASRLPGIDAAVHLAGESIASGRWNAEKKRRIEESRVRGTALLARTLADLPAPPKVVVSASAMGYYGDRGDEELTERSSPGTGFLPDVCRKWEAALEPAASKGIRVVPVRWGLVLSRRGGALPRMLLPFRLGLGGTLGDGRQYMSWITLDDAVGVLRHALRTEHLAGPVNGASPEAVTNRAFTKALGRALSRPAVLPVPAFAVRLLFGEMGDALLLSSARLVPARLAESGFRFRDPSIEPALRRVLA